MRDRTIATPCRIHPSAFAPFRVLGLELESEYGTWPSYSTIGSCSPSRGRSRVRRDKHAARLQRRRHHDLIRGAEQPQLVQVQGFVAPCSKKRGDARGDRLVDQQPHIDERRGSSCSSTAAAAYLRASRTSSIVSCGNSATISAVVMPSATMPTTVATGIRVPRMQGTPPITRWSTEIRSKAMTHSTSRQSSFPKPPLEDGDTYKVRLERTQCSSRPEPSP